MSYAGVQDLLFGPFRLSVRHRSLSRGGRPVALTGRAFDVLATLVASPDAVVTKDELMRRVWGGVLVEENNLHVQIAALRRALGAGERYIVTIHGRGYLFVGDLRPAFNPASANPSLATLAALSREEVLAVLDLSRSWEPAEFGDLIVTGRRLPSRPDAGQPASLERPTAQPRT